MAEPAVPTALHERPQASLVQVAIRILGLCLFGLYLLLGPVDIEATIAQLRGLPLGTWLLACGCNLLPPLVIALRLKCLLRGRRHEVGWPPLARDALRSTALNTVTLVGAGDLYRINRLRAHGIPLVAGGSVVFLDRAFGVGALVALALTLQATGLARTIDGSGALAGALIVLVAILVTGFVATKSRLTDGVSQHPRVAGLIRSVRGDRPLPGRIVAQATTLSFVACGAWILGVYVLGEGLGLALPPFAYLEAAPLVALATFVPITVGGVGLREAGYVVLLGGYGASASACVALGVAQFSTFLGVAAIGGLLFARAD